MESLKTTLIIIAVAAVGTFGSYLLDHRQSGKFYLINFGIFGLYCLWGYFYDRWKFRRALKKAKQEINLQRTV